MFNSIGAVVRKLRSGIKELPQRSEDREASYRTRVLPGAEFGRRQATHLLTSMSSSSTVGTYNLNDLVAIDHNPR
jgi:hypothetical protein